jgi:hypothetical protein
MPRTQPNRAPTPLQLSSGNAADFKANSAGCESNSADSLSNSAACASNTAELQLTSLQSSKGNSAENDAKAAAFVTNSAVSQLIDRRAVSLLSSSTTKATSMESITESEREGRGGRLSPVLLGRSVRPAPNFVFGRSRASRSERRTRAVPHRTGLGNRLLQQKSGLPHKGSPFCIWR